MKMRDRGRIARAAHRLMRARQGLRQLRHEALEARQLLSCEPVAGQLGDWTNCHPLDKEYHEATSLPDRAGELLSADVDASGQSPRAALARPGFLATSGGFGSIHYRQMETGVAIPDAVEFRGYWPPIASSSGTLIVPSDPNRGPSFGWISSDSILGDVDTGVVEASMWNVFGEEPTRVVFRGAAGATSITGNILYGPANQAMITLVHNGRRYQYPVELVDSAPMCVLRRKFHRPS